MDRITENLIYEARTLLASVESLIAGDLNWDVEDLDGYTSTLEAVRTAEALRELEELIGGTNNGKLMLNRIPQGLRRHVPWLISTGDLTLATFVATGDSIRSASLDARMLATSPRHAS